MNKHQLKEKIGRFLELYVIQMAGLSLVCSIFYWGFSVEIFNFVKKVLPFLSKTNVEISVWTLIILIAASVVVSLTLSICIFGISDNRFNREALNNCFNS